MIYLDYSANTPADERVLARFCAVERRCPGNANSHHQAGLDAKAEIDHATQTIARLLRVQPAEIIYTSGASESNNFALKGLARLSRHVGKHIISTPLEHSSVSGTLTALQEQGYEIDLVDIKRDGTIDLDHLKELLRPDTIVVAVTMVDSELGVVQPVKEISELLQAWPNCHLHVDATQAVGKIPVSFEGVDTMSLTAHKFYRLNCIGLLLKRRKLALEPLIHGGESTTIYRSGTPTVALAASLETALEAGSTDFKADGEVFIVTTEPDDVYAIQEDLARAGYEILSAEKTKRASTGVTLDNEDDIKFMNLLIEKLEDDDDVMDVYHNWENCDG